MGDKLILGDVLLPNMRTYIYDDYKDYKEHVAYIVQVEHTEAIIFI